MISCMRALVLLSCLLSCTTNIVSETTDADKFETLLSEVKAVSFEQFDTVLQEMGDEAEQRRILALTDPSNGKTFLHYAVENDFQGLLYQVMGETLDGEPLDQSVYTNSIDVNARDNDGHTALILASERGDHFSSHALIRMNADWNISSNKRKGWYPIHFAAAGATDGHSEVLAHLLFELGDIAAVEANSRSEEREIFRRDFPHTLSVNFTTADTLESPLTLATASLMQEKLIYLTTFYPDIDYQIPSSGDTALHIAAREATEMDFLMELLEADANMNITNNAGETPRTLVADNSNFTPADLVLFNSYLHGANLTDEFPAYDSEWVADDDLLRSSNNEDEEAINENPDSTLDLDDVEEWELSDFDDYLDEPKEEQKEQEQEDEEQEDETAIEFQKEGTFVHNGEL